MRRMLGTGTGVLVLATGLLAVGAAAGWAVNRDDTTVVHTCYRVAKDGTPVRNATLRLVTGDAVCKRNERSLVWSQRGTPGPAGAPGPAGPPGPPGPAGGPGNGTADCDLERRIANAVPGFQTTGNCAPPPLCNDDGFEPDDTLAQATAVDLGTTTSAVACSGDDDYFAVAAAGSTVTASLTFETTAILEVALLDSAGNVLASAAGSSPQSVRTAGPAAGTVYVRVRAAGNAQGSYTLTL
jgi:hypothetical protein